MNHQKDLFLLADLCMDTLFTGTVRPQYGQAEQLINDYALELGGSAAIFASQFTKLGGSVGLIAKVGNDAFGQILLQQLQSIGISTEFITADKTVKTAVGVGLSDGTDRAMLTYLGSIQALQLTDIQTEMIERTRHWHIASYFLLEQFWDFWLEFLPVLQQKGITISLDTNWAPRENWQQVHAILPFVDVFLPNEEEARCISGEKDVGKAGEWLAERVGLTVIKCGAAGARAFQGEEVHHWDIPVEWTESLVIADTTGAGDNFDAGFLYNWLKNKSLEECVKWGMRCGTSSLSKIGGIAGQVMQ
jgi:sugar/nucleoside kinase (ribokinase family)